MTPLVRGWFPLRYHGPHSLHLLPHLAHWPWGHFAHILPLHTEHALQVTPVTCHLARGLPLDTDMDGHPLLLEAADPRGSISYTVGHTQAYILLDQTVGA